LKLENFDKEVSDMNIINPIARVFDYLICNWEDVMKKKIVIAQFLTVVLIVLTACARTSEEDIAVCNIYQDLVDTWPADSEAIQAAESIDAIFENITAVGKSLIAVSESANTLELGEAGKAVGEAVSKFAEANAGLIEQGFVPFFDESLIGGETLSQLCEEIGIPIAIP